MLVFEILPDDRIIIEVPLSGEKFLIRRGDLLYALLCNVGTRIKLPCRQQAKGEGNHYGEAG